MNYVLDGYDIAPWILVWYKLFDLAVVELVERSWLVEELIFYSKWFDSYYAATLKDYLNFEWDFRGELFWESVYGHIFKLNYNYFEDDLWLVCSFTSFIRFPIVPFSSVINLVVYDLIFIFAGLFETF